MAKSGILTNACFDSCLRISYVHGGNVFYQPGDTLGPRVLSDYELVLIIDGHVTYSVSGQSYCAAPGAIILARPGFHEFYRWDPKRHTQHAFFHFKLEAPLSHWPDEAKWPIVVPNAEPVCVEMLKYVVKLCANHARWPMERPAPEVCCFIKALLETLLAQDPIVLSASDPARPQPVQRAIQWMRQMIDAEPERPLRLEKVAAAAGVTPKHLCRLFQRNVGSGPMTVNRLLRLQLALALLRRSNLTIKQISQRCGFASQFQFSHCFSQVFRHSPTAMRQNIMRGDILPSSPLPPDLMPRIHW